MISLELSETIWSTFELYLSHKINKNTSIKIYNIIIMKEKTS